MSKIYHLHDDEGHLIASWGEEFHKALMEHPVLKDLRDRMEDSGCMPDAGDEKEEHF